MTLMEEIVVPMVGAGPSGLALAACLSLYSIPCVILEREDCCACLWKKLSYDRLNLHLAKQFYQLPFMPFPESASSVYILKAFYVEYLDKYVTQFNIKPRYFSLLQSAGFDGELKKWRVEVINTLTREVEIYNAEFLIVTTGKNCQGLIPQLPGLETFGGEILHFSEHKSDSKYTDKDVLVIGCGNSGMEISLDLSNYGSHPMMVVRSPDYEHVLNENGLPKNNFPIHWKGEKNLYCCGLSRSGLFGVSMDAKAIAEDIKSVISEKMEK